MIGKRIPRVFNRVLAVTVLSTSLPLSSGCLSRDFFNSAQIDGEADTIQVPQSRISALLNAAQHYPEECSPDQRFCVSFAPKNLPILPMLKAISEAQSEIIISTYNFNVPELGRALVDALSRGVRVEFLQDFRHVFPEPNGQKRLRVWHLLPSHPNLTRWAIPVLRGSNPQMHNKLLLVDGQSLFLGSANWTLTGVVGNFENVLILRDPTLISTFREEMNELRHTAQKACELFAQPKENCGSPDLNWNEDFHHLVTNGTFMQSSMRDKAGFQNSLAQFYKTMHSTYDTLKAQNLAPAALRDQLIKTKTKILSDLEKPQIQADGSTRLSPFFCRQFQFKDISCNCSSVSTQLRAFNEPGALALADSLQCEKYSQDLNNVYGFGVCWNNGLLDEKNQGRAQNIEACLSSPRAFVELADSLGKKEKFVNGTPANGRATEPILSDNQETTIAFAPEDRPEELLTLWMRAIAKASKENKKTFLYTSTNFVTSRPLSDALAEIKANGGKLQVMFDRGRWDDPSFQQRQAKLSELGVYHGTAAQTDLHDPSPANSITVFNNQLIGDYGANHNKMAIGGDGQNIYVATGSANWSFTGLHRNDENVLLSRNPWLTTIYAKEILSELYAYRYGHDSRGAFASELSFFKEAISCLSASLGETPQCTINGVNWEPDTKSHIILGIRGVPVGADRSLWVRLSTPEGSLSLPAFTHQSFSGNWVASLPVARSSDKISFKFYHAPIDHDPARGLQDAVWEYDGPDRRASSPALAFFCTHQDARWGQKVDVTWCR